VTASLPATVEYLLPGMDDATMPPLPLLLSGVALVGDMEDLGNQRWRQRPPPTPVRNVVWAVGLGCSAGVLLGLLRRRCSVFLAAPQWWGHQGSARPARHQSGGVFF
jgi:hypothetical protein